MKHRVRIVTEKNHMNNNFFTYFCESGIVSGFLYTHTHTHIWFFDRKNLPFLNNLLGPSISKKNKIGTFFL